MRKGLTLGKYMPVHKGHLALIDFAKQHCDLLYVLVCASDPQESISGKIRWEWMKKVCKGDSKVEVCYSDDPVPYTAHSSREISQIWAAYLKPKFPDVTLFFSSEPYGDFLAEYMNIKHLTFNPQRDFVPISATDIRNNPTKYYDYLPYQIQSDFVRKIAIVGAESTGKSTLTQQLATHFHTLYVPEVARYMMQSSYDCTYELLIKIAQRHAEEIIAQQKDAYKFLFCDTDLLVTMAYSEYLFQKTLLSENWIQTANEMDLYLILDTDLSYHQDGTRLGNVFQSEIQKRIIEKVINTNKPYVYINGKNEIRLENAIKQITDFFDL